MKFYTSELCAASLSKIIVKFQTFSWSLRVLKIYIYKKWLYFLPIEKFSLNNVAFLYKLLP